MREFANRESSGLDPALEDLADKAIGAMIEVHKGLGPGLPEGVYRKAVSHELDIRGISHECERRVPVVYKGKLVGEGRIDILVEGRLIIELKAIECLTDVHVAQCIAYLCATNLELAILANFNVAQMSNGIRRIIRSGKYKRS
jgi:GxxExxY protein